MFKFNKGDLIRDRIYTEDVALIFDASPLEYEPVVFGLHWIAGKTAGQATYELQEEVEKDFELLSACKVNL